MNNYHQAQQECDTTTQDAITQAVPPAGPRTLYIPTFDLFDTHDDLDEFFAASRQENETADQ